MLKFYGAIVETPTGGKISTGIAATDENSAKKQLVEEFNYVKVHDIKPCNKINSLLKT